MDIKVIVDSGCDIPAQDALANNVEIVPLSLTVGEEILLDDDELDLEALREKMHLFQGKTVTACPSPGSYSEAFMKAAESFCVTISENLSGSFNSAVIARDMVAEEGHVVHVINSKTASAGEALIAYKLLEMIEDRMSFQMIKEQIEEFVDGVRTYFVLESLENLIKAGRLNKVAGKLISALNIRPIMGEDGKGNIAFNSYARSRKQILEKMAGFIKESGKPTKGENLVISHNNNLDMAQSLKELIAGRYDFKKIIIVPTRGIATLYTCDKGIVMAF